MSDRIGRKVCLGFVFLLTGFSVLFLYALTLIGDSTFNLLEDMYLDPPINRSIFFFETSAWASTGNIVHLTSRQACAVESAALHNPNQEVFLMYSSPVSRFTSKEDHAFKSLITYRNVHFVRLYLDSFLKDTPLENWYDYSELVTSVYMTTHTSDVLRFTALWKYGGTYLNFDVILAQPLEKLGVNWAVMEDWNKAPSVDAINFALGGVGRLFTNLALRQIKRHFRGDVLDHNGPRVMDYAMRRICDNHKLPRAKSERRCQGIRLFEPDIFYPISSEEHSLYFEPEGMSRLMAVENISYGYHTWSKFTNHIRAIDGALPDSVDIPIRYLAKRFCPKVYAAAEIDF